MFSFFKRRYLSQVKKGHKLSPENQHELKSRIRRRLRSEDYTCRLPKETKPRIRYKLSKKTKYVRAVKIIEVYQ